MTEIFALMWLGDIARNLDNILTIFTVIYIITAIGVLICVCIVQGSNDFTEYTEKENMAFAKLFTKSAYWAVPVILFGLALPRSDTIRLGIAIRAGSMIATTQLGAKATEAAEAILNRIIKEENGK